MNFFFKKEFETTLHEDPNISEIRFIQDNQNLSMELLSYDLKQATLLKGRLNAARGLNEMDNPNRQNFILHLDESEKKVVLTGNIYNAFTLLTGYELISKKIAATILADLGVKDFLDKTKNFILPENVITDENIISTQSDLATTQENYIQELLKLDSTQFEKAIADFSVSLASCGKNVDFRSQDPVKKITTSK